MHARTRRTTRALAVVAVCATTAIPVGAVLPATADVPEDSATFLSTLQYGRGWDYFAPEAPADAGALAFAKEDLGFGANQPNLLATVQAVPGVAGADLVEVPAPSTWAADPAPTTPVPAANADGVATFAASWLATQNFTTGDAAWGVLSFAATATAKTKAEEIYAPIPNGLPVANPGANGLAALAAASLSKSADLPTYAGNIAATLSGTGLYGTTDPTFDGVFRQSVALLGLHAADAVPDAAAVAWLVDQQCGDGSFSSYNPTPDQDCPPFDPATFTGGPSTDATAVAAQALRAVGLAAEAVAAEDYLRSIKGADGSWDDGNPNSTGLALTALNAADRLGSAPIPTATPTPAPTPTPSTSASTTATLSTTSVAPGGRLTASGGGFAAGEAVEVYVLSTPVNVGSTTANAQGVASLTFTVPTTLSRGSHTVELRGASGRVVSASFTVTGTSGGGLAYSGANESTVPLALAGLALLGVGAAFLTVGRKGARR